MRMTFNLRRSLKKSQVARKLFRSVRTFVATKLQEKFGKSNSSFTYN